MSVLDAEYDYVEKLEFPPAQQKSLDRVADTIRMRFIKEYVLNRNVDAYSTDQETDWALVCRRDYRFSVVYRAIFDGLFVSSVLQCLAIYKTKSLVFWPLAVWPLVYYLRKPTLFQQNNYRQFGLLNLGEEYELGAARNRVLREVNDLTHRADF